MPLKSVQHFNFMGIYPQHYNFMGIDPQHYKLEQDTLNHV